MNIKQAAEALNARFRDLQSGGETSSVPLVRGDVLSRIGLTLLLKEAFQRGEFGVGKDKYVIDPDRLAKDPEYVEKIDKAVPGASIPGTAITGLRRGAEKLHEWAPNYFRAPVTGLWSDNPDVDPIRSMANLPTLALADAALNAPRIGFRRENPINLAGEVGRNVQTAGLQAELDRIGLKIKDPKTMSNLNELISNARYHDRASVKKPAGMWTPWHWSRFGKVDEAGKLIPRNLEIDAKGNSRFVDVKNPTSDDFRRVDVKIEEPVRRANNNTIAASSKPDSRTITFDADTNKRIMTQGAGDKKYWKNFFAGGSREAMSPASAMTMRSGYYLAPLLYDIYRTDVNKEERQLADLREAMRAAVDGKKDDSGKPVEPGMALRSEEYKRRTAEAAAKAREETFARIRDLFSRKDG